jgi:fatty-acyl-CoA synthase
MLRFARRREALARIDEDPGAQFEGYSGPVETEEKILRDVFARGDAWMRTGDLMRCDAHGFYTFVDRIGDTFRRKGENVATLEVSSVIQACPGPGSDRRRRGGSRRRRPR